MSHFQALEALLRAGWQLDYRPHSRHRWRLSFYSTTDRHTHMHAHTLRECVDMADRHVRDQKLEPAT